MPDTYEKLMKIRESIGKSDEEAVLEQEFRSMESQSIDYGIMEKADVYKRQRIRWKNIYHNVWRV